MATRYTRVSINVKNAVYPLTLRVCAIKSIPLMIVQKVAPKRQVLRGKQTLVEPKNEIQHEAHLKIDLTAEYKLRP